MVQLLVTGFQLLEEVEIQLCSYSWPLADSSGGRYRVVGIDTSILSEESVRYRYQSGIEQTSIPNITISPAQTEYRPLPTSHCGQH